MSIAARRGADLSFRTVGLLILPDHADATISLMPQVSTLVTADCHLSPLSSRRSKATEELVQSEAWEFAREAHPAEWDQVAYGPKSATRRIDFAGDAAAGIHRSIGDGAPTERMRSIVLDAGRVGARHDRQRSAEYRVGGK